MGRKIFIVYKRKPNETMVSPYNTELLNLMKSNMNLQFSQESMNYWHIYVQICVKKKGNLVKLEEVCQIITMLKCESNIEKSRKCFLVCFLKCFQKVRFLLMMPSNIFFLIGIHSMQG